MPLMGSSMTYKVIPKGLPGYDDYHAIQITYNIQVQPQICRRNKVYIVELVLVSFILLLEQVILIKF